MRLQAHQLKAMTAHKAAGLPAEAFVMPAPVARKPRDNREWRIQVAFFKLWRSYAQKHDIESCLMFSVPNGSALSAGSAEWQKTLRAIRGRQLKDAGLTNGVSDIVFLYPSGKWHSMVIEFKTPEGVMSDDQLVFRASVMRVGVRHVVCVDPHEAMRAVENYLNA